MVKKKESLPLFSVEKEVHLLEDDKKLERNIENILKASEKELRESFAKVNEGFVFFNGSLTESHKYILKKLNEVFGETELSKSIKSGTINKSFQPSEIPDFLTFYSNERGKLKEILISIKTSANKDGINLAERKTKPFTVLEEKREKINKVKFTIRRYFNLSFLKLFCSTSLNEGVRFMKLIAFDFVKFPEWRGVETQKYFWKLFNENATLLKSDNQQFKNLGLEIAGMYFGYMTMIVRDFTDMNEQFRFFLLPDYEVVPKDEKKNNLNWLKERYDLLELFELEITHETYTRKNILEVYSLIFREMINQFLLFYEIIIKLIEIFGTSIFTKYVLGFFAEKIQWHKKSSIYEIMKSFSIMSLMHEKYNAELNQIKEYVSAFEKVKEQTVGLNKKIFDLLSSFGETLDPEIAALYTAAFSFLSEEWSLKQIDKFETQRIIELQKQLKDK